uniref:lipid-binding SYLF domain-containing protein n=1 Tax=Ningiella ruwaisensis TaxID=2364274 RepID=UPI00109FCAB3|nr:YSC84-related protein [Ningiella ruwaisensis]
MKFISVATGIFLLFSLAGCASMGSGSNAEKRQVILEMQQDALAKLYARKPAAKAEIAASPGYAVFSNANVNLFLVSAGTGYGVVQNNATGKKTYMNMAEGGVGLGLGAKDYRIVMVFHNAKAMDRFIEQGWTFGGNADAAAKAGEKGKSIEGEAYYGDVSVYTMTESGLALQATVKGTKFWKDKELN